MEDQRRGAVVLVRHGQTEWSKSGQHTSRTDLALLSEGEEAARAVGRRLAGRHFDLVLSSPLRRALDTSNLAGFGARVEVTDDLREWDYGDDEGRTTPEIQLERPSWTIWGEGPRGGETLHELAERADRVVARVRAVDGDTLVFAHGHLLRVLAARWLDLPPVAGQLFALGPATLSELGWERGLPVLVRWNELP